MCTQADKALSKELTPLLMEGSPTKTMTRKIREYCITHLQATPLWLRTKDQIKLHALYFRRPNARYNVICLHGYLFQATPPKEWCCSLAYLLPEANVLMFDWRGLGDSEGYNGFFWKNDFGSRAWLDIQAATDFYKQKNSLPVVAIGFCLGAAMLLHAISQAKLHHFNQPDVIILNGMFDRFENIFSRMKQFYVLPLYAALVASGIGTLAATALMNGSLFNLNPIELAHGIQQPALIQLLAEDPFVPLSSGLAVYELFPGYKELCISTIGKHVRLHTAAPAQFKQVVDRFINTTLQQLPSPQLHAEA